MEIGQTGPIGASVMHHVEMARKHKQGTVQNLLLLMKAKTAVTPILRLQTGHAILKNVQLVLISFHVTLWSFISNKKYSICMLYFAKL